MESSGSSLVSYKSIPGESDVFRFFDLPSEVRVCIYELLLVFPKTIDLDPTNFRNIAPRLRLFLVSHRFHDEAYRIFYGANTFRMFPTHGRFFHTKYPLLARLPPRYRAAITTMELRLGPGWTSPPKGWATSARLGLSDAKHLWFLRVFIECDPASSDIFAGFRRKDDFFTLYCGELLTSIFAQVPSLADVQLDAWSWVKKDSPLVRELSGRAKVANKRVKWGPTWHEVEDVEAALSMLTL